MTRSENMEHVWKVGDRVRALCGVGDYIRSGDVGTVAAIDCGGCLWCTWDNPVTPELDEFGWCIRADEVAPADAAIASLSAQQPPAEAMEAWHSAMNDVGELRANAPDERYASRAARVESWIKANRPEPPSAPVGVERILAEMREEGQADIVDGGVVLEWEDDLRNALAQQPAAIGEEIMVNAAHDVYTLPLQPSGLSSGPRFVVHVPGPEKPAAPSGEAVAGDAESAGTGNHARCVLSAIIDNYRRSATQPGGSDNDR